RDFHVTGVQTCALPIYLWFRIWCRSVSLLQFRCVGVTPHIQVCALVMEFRSTDRFVLQSAHHMLSRVIVLGNANRTCSMFGIPRSEERRVGREGSNRWW